MTCQDCQGLNTSVLFPGTVSQHWDEVCKDGNCYQLRIQDAQSDVIIFCKIVFVTKNYFHPLQTLRTQIVLALTLFDFKIFEFTRSESVCPFSSSPVIFIACAYNEPCPSVTLSFLRVTKIFHKARSQEVDKKFDGNEKQAKKKKNNLPFFFI